MSPPIVKAVALPDPVARSARQSCTVLKILADENQKLKKKRIPENRSTGLQKSEMATALNNDKNTADK